MYLPVKFNKNQYNLEDMAPTSLPHFRKICDYWFYIKQAGFLKKQKTLPCWFCAETQRRKFCLCVFYIWDLINLILYFQRGIGL